MSDRAEFMRPSEDEGVFPVDVLDAQPYLWGLPIEYLVGGSHTSFSMDAVVESALRSYLDRPTPGELRRELLRVGDPTPLLLAAEDRRLSSTLGAKEVRRLVNAANRHLNRIMADAHARLAGCRVRGERLETTRTFANLPERLAEVRGLLVKDGKKLADANARLDVLAADLSAAEERECERLKSDLARWTAKATEAAETGDMIAMVERALNQKNHVGARRLLRDLERGEWALSPEAIPYRGALPLRESVEDIITWMTPSPTPKPQGFEHQWAPRVDDTVGMRLLEAIASARKTGATAAEFGEVLLAIEASLGVLPSMSAKDKVRVGHDGYHATLDGLRFEGFYAFDGPEYDAGVPVFIPQLGSLAARADPAEWNGEPDQTESSADEVPRATRYTIVIADTRTAVVQRQLYLGWKQLLALVGDSHRRHNLARMLGAQVNRDDAFPDSAHRDSRRALMMGRADVVETMLAGNGPALWVGPPGSGKTAALSRAEVIAREKGWRVQRLTGTKEVAAFLDELDSVRTLDDWLGGYQAQPRFITIDDVGERELEDHDLVVRAVVRLQTLRDHSDPRITCACTADVSLIAGTFQPPYRHLECLAFHETREVLTRLMDLTSGSATQEAWDHLAFYCGGYPRVIHLVLRHLRGATAPGVAWRADEGSVRAILSSNEIREVTRRLLLDPLRRLPQLVSFTLASLLDALTTQTGASASLDATSLHRRMTNELRINASPDDILRSLQCLEACYLIENKGDSWRPVDMAFGSLLWDTGMDGFVDDTLEAAINA